MNKNNQPKTPIVNITGKTPFGDLLLQSAPDMGLLQRQLKMYFENSIKSQNSTWDAKELQEILNRPANRVPELKMFEFEPNQRVYEVALVLLIARSVNGAEDRSFIPAWQRPGQSSVMKEFTEKESWDGFIYENPDDDSVSVATIPIEIKSTMINPLKDTVLSPNQLLSDRLPGLKDYFQAEGSICALFIPPYTATGESLSFDLKDATLNINEVVAYEAMGCVCLLAFPKNKKGETVITLYCHFVSKNPILASNGNIEHVDIAKMEFGII